MVWYDKEGTPVRPETDSSGTDTLYTEANPELAVSGNFGHKVGWTETMGQSAAGFPLFRTETFHGQIWNLQVPGARNVVKSAGLAVYSHTDPENPLLVRSAGLELVDSPAVCAALGFKGVIGGVVTGDAVPPIATSHACPSPRQGTGGAGAGVVMLEPPRRTQRADAAISCPTLRVKCRSGQTSRVCAYKGLARKRR